ncbi:MAG: replication initiation protein [Acidaminococcaceae bacterium]|nr:replication initiation protein [Acidaminococcaceae bacterium]
MAISHEKRVELAQYKQTQADKDQGLTVRKANQLIQKNRFDMTVREQRLLLYCISRIKPTDKGGELYKIKIRDVCRASGISREIDGEAYKAVYDALKKLDSFNFTLIDENNKKDIFVHWIRDTEIDRNPGGFISFRFDPKITPYLFNVRKYFTQYELGNVMQMKSVYGIRLYELVKSYENIHEKTFDLRELRYLLGAEEKSYDRYSNLKQKIIDPAINEILAYSDLKVTAIEVKQGRKVTGIKFVISDGSADRMERRLEQIDRERHPERYTTP